MTQKTFEKLTEKYGRCQADPSGPAEQVEQPEQYPVLERWQDSEPVRMFSVFLKEFTDQGIYLVQTKEGIPMLHFQPGIKVKEKDPERYSVAEHAAWLLEQARSDLQQLISNGVLTLQPYKGIWL